MNKVYRVILQRHLKNAIKEELEKPYTLNGKELYVAGPWGVSFNEDDGFEKGDATFDFERYYEQQKFKYSAEEVSIDLKKLDKAIKDNKDYYGRRGTDTNPLIKVGKLFNAYYVLDIANALENPKIYVSKESRNDIMFFESAAGRGILISLNIDTPIRKITVMTV